MKRKPATDDADHAETVDADWMAPFMAPSQHVVINVDVMTPQQRAEFMARGVPIGVTNMEKFVEQGVQASRTQAQRARKPRGDAELEDIVRMLARGVGTTKELWPELLSKLDADGCEPEEHANGVEERKWKITYTNTDESGRSRKRKVSFDKFQTMLGKNRKPA